MNYSIIRYMLGKVVLTVGLLMLLPAACAVIYKENIAFIYAACALGSALVGWLMSRTKPKRTSFYAKEGFVVCALSWIIMSLIGALPMWLSGEFTFIDALFEIISGFTTTGSSAAANVEALTKGTLFWRSFSHWIGGMGVLVFILALLPMAGGQSLYFMKAESPGPDVEKALPRMQNSAKWLYIIYTILTLAQMVILIASGLNVFDAVTTTFATAGTGGFSNYAIGLSDYTIFQQNVCTVFMMLFGVNFNFYFFFLAKRFKDALKMEEVRWYFGIYFVCCLLMAINVTMNMGGAFAYNLQQALFQGASIMTTTGFATCDFNLWPDFAKAILVFLMFIGACAGSTGGGIKVCRIVIYLKTAVKEFQHLIHPKAVKIVKFEGKKVEHDVLRSINIYLVCYFLIFTVSVLLVSLNNIGGVSAFTAVAATFNNIGPGLGIVGPMGGFHSLSTLSKLVLSFDMLAGRLELFPMLILFFPGTWRAKSR